MLSLPPAFVLSQDQTLKFETGFDDGLATIDWSLALKKLTRIYDFDNPTCVGIEVCLLVYLKRYRRLFLRLRSPGNRKDTRRLRFSFFLQQCQSAGNRSSRPQWSQTAQKTKTFAGFPFGEPAGFAVCVLISYRGIVAEAPVSLSDAVYR